jgi:hypothetical protein
MAQSKAQPGDVITAAFVNQILDRLDALERQVAKTPVPPSKPVTELPSIGLVERGKLEERGIKTIDDMSRANVVEVAKVLELDLEEATRMVERAKNWPQQ